ncbi:MAG TPA: heparan-alpha-glucosaminide N-acetyltransferase domain-containing protein [Methylomirabilota bacterium]|nr:heparan-alpha-glucosaminide N-acetyltransferase domain-containing protein [Methylomirabilota bacterium]
MAPLTPPGGSPRPGGAGARLDSRLAYLDGLRGVALVLMVLNHTARWWIDTHMTWARYELIYVTLTTAAPIFLFLVGFCLPLALRPGNSESFGALARAFVPRGVRIVLAGFLLNLVVFPDEPILSGGVLQTIGLAVIVMVPAMWLLRMRGGIAVLLAIAVASYVSFALTFETITRFVQRHSTTGLVLFYDFPPWPWLSLVILGLVLGWTWLDAHRRSREEGARYLATCAVVGAVLVAAFLAYDWWAATPVRFGMKRDFILNRHWTPRGAALAWVLGSLLLMLAGAYWVWEVVRLRLRWLIVLGQTALVLYFIHQIIAYTFVHNWLEWRFNTWPWFWLANAVFMAVLLALGAAWMELKKKLAPLRARVRARLSAGTAA